MIISGAGTKQCLTWIKVLLKTEQFDYLLEKLILLYCICHIFSANPAPGKNPSQDSDQVHAGPPCTQQFGKRSWSL